MMMHDLVLWLALFPLAAMVLASLAMLIGTLTNIDQPDDDGTLWYDDEWAA